MKFKVGDKVICIGTSVGEQGEEYGGCGWSRGRIFIVDHTTMDDWDNSQICWPGDNGGGIYSTHLRLLRGNPNCEGIRV